MNRPFRSNDDKFYARTTGVMISKSEFFSLVDEKLESALLKIKGVSEKQIEFAKKIVKQSHASCMASVLRCISDARYYKIIEYREGVPAIVACFLDLYSLLNAAQYMCTILTAGQLIDLLKVQDNPREFQQTAMKLAKYETSYQDYKKFLIENNITND